MFRDDYVLRHIRLFVQFLARIFGLIESDDLDLALELLRQAFRDYLGVDMESLLTIPEERLLDFLTFGERGGLGLSKCSFAITLLKQTGEVLRAKGRPDQAQTYLEKSLSLLLETRLAAEEDLDFPDFTPTVDDLLARAGERKLSIDTRATLVFYLEREGQYARAAEILEGMRADQPDNQDVLDLGASFFEYLLDESDAALEKGGLTRAELRGKLDSWASGDQQ